VYGVEAANAPEEALKTIARIAISRARRFPPAEPSKPCRTEVWTH
jgi:hypothetical protein